jgi:hypothetical protein
MRENWILEHDSADIPSDLPEVNQQILIPADSSAPGNIAGKYPVSTKTERQITPDWILYISLLYLISLAWMKLIYSKFFTHIFKSAVNYQLSLILYNEPGIMKKRIFLYLNISYFLVAGLFFYLIAGYFDLSIPGIEGIKFLFAIILFMMAYSLFRIFLMKTTGGLFNTQGLFSEAIFHILLFNKIAAILLAPFLLLIAYTKGIFLDISVYTGLTLFTIIAFARFYHALIFISKSVLSLFYFILYLCTLEILPVLVILKLIFSLSKGI